MVDAAGIRDPFTRNWLDLLSFLLSGLPANGTIAAEVAFMFAQWYAPGLFASQTAAALRACTMPGACPKGRSRRSVHALPATSAHPMPLPKRLLPVLHSPAAGT